MTEEKSDLYLKRFEARNFKAIKDITLNIDGNAVVLGGKNAQGKTSILDGIETLINGKPTEMKEPIRHGQAKADLFGDFGLFTAKRTFKNSGQQLVVSMNDGEPIKKPQKVMSALWEGISFDPVAFVTKKPADQMQVLKEITGLDFSALDLEAKEKYDERTTINRLLSDKKAQLASLEYHENAKGEEVSISGLTARLQEIGELEKEQDAIRDRLEKAESKKQDCAKHVERAKADVARLKTELADAINVINCLDDDLFEASGLVEKGISEVEALPILDAGPVRAALNGAEEANRLVRENGARAETVNEQRALEDKSELLTERIDEIKELKKRQLADAKFPVEGLSFNDNGPTLGGVPFAQASQAQRLSVSVSIAMALAPRLKLLLVRDAAVLDDDGLATLRQLAEEHDVTMIIERVGSRDEGAIIIEAGEIK